MIKMKKVNYIIFLFALTSFVNPIEDEPFNILNLKCEYRNNPLGIDVPNPTLGWQVETTEKSWIQSAYEISVASTENLLTQDKGDIWESGKINSSESANIIYEGKKLISNTKYYWKVRVWDSKGKQSVWSKPAFWHTGIFDADEWHAKWISSRYVEAKQGHLQIPERAEPWIFLPTTPDTAALLLRKKTEVAKQPVKAIAFISGLGYYELYINGRKVGDHILDPNFTDYNARVNYLTYNVLNFIKPGENVIGVILGNGWFNLPTPDLFQNEKACWKTAPKLLLNISISFTDGTTQTIVSDGTWKWNTGEIVFNCIRGGETIDNRQKRKGWDNIGYDDSLWKTVVEVPAPFGTLSAQNMPPMRINESVKPVKMWEHEKGVFIFDFGKNITGFIQLKIAGKEGQTLILNSNEKLLKDSTLDINNSHSHTFGRFQKEIFILNGDGEETFEPRFTYHGFRYVQVEGITSKPNIDCISAKSVHTDLQYAGEFECSNNRINQLNKARQRTLLNCIHGMPGEEPVREKMGWNLDNYGNMLSYIYNFDAATSFIKLFKDLIDGQESNGHIPPIIPTDGWGYLQSGNKLGFTHTEANTIYCDDPWWGAALAIVANRLYDLYGDKRILEEAYRPMKKYVDFITSTAENNIIKWSLGDWCDKDWGNSPGPGNTSVELTSTAGYYYLVILLSYNASTIGRKEDSGKYSLLAENIKATFNQKFLNKENGMYERGSQTAQALALSVGLVPDDYRVKAEEILINDIKINEYHTSTGFIGVMPEMNWLAENSHAEIAFRMISQEEAPGWLYMVKDETSTLGEQLYSRNKNFHHPFGAYIGSWFYEYVAGIRSDRAEPGFKKIIIHPHFISSLTFAKGEYKSIYGTIKSEWKQEHNKILLNISIPANTTAAVYLPTSNVNNITETGKPVVNRKDIYLIKQEKDNTIIQTGSGNYSFIVKLNNIN